MQAHRPAALSSAQALGRAEALMKEALRILDQTPSSCAAAHLDHAISLLVMGAGAFAVVDPSAGRADTKH